MGVALGGGRLGLKGMVAGQSSKNGARPGTKQNRVRTVGNALTGEDVDVKT
jgi:hypothetical protein